MEKYVNDARNAAYFPALSESLIIHPRSGPDVTHVSLDLRIMM